MSLLKKILGPKSKYDKSIPYTYEARVRIIEGGDEFNSYFSDTICGLVEYLHQKGIRPEDAQIIEVYQERELPLGEKLLTTPDRQWLFKPDICRSFAGHYSGHIRENSCTFDDRECKGSGP
jgi:hypothetical protein